MVVFVIANSPLFSTTLGLDGFVTTIFAIGSHVGGIGGKYWNVSGSAVPSAVKTGKPITD